MSNFNLQDPTQYSYHLQARCDGILRPSKAESVGGYNLPDWFSFGNITPALNNHGQIAFKVLGAWQQGIWFGTQSTGRLVYIAPRGVCLSQISLNNQNCLAWEQLRSRDQDGLWYWQLATQRSIHLTSEPRGSRGWTLPTLNDHNQIGFRAKFFAGYAYALYDVNASLGESLQPDRDSLSTFVTVNDLEPTSIYSYLFLPSLNNQGQMAAKVRLGNPGELGERQPDQIRIFAADGHSQLLLWSQKFDPDSPYRSFDNSVSFNDLGHLVFIATLASGQRGVFRYNRQQVDAIALEGEGNLAQIERFPPQLNNQGTIVFRAFDTQGARAIWVSDGLSISKVVSEGDILPTDLGALRLLRPDGEPVFSGNPTLNDRGEIAFAACLSDPEDPELGYGAGLFLAKPIPIERTSRNPGALRSSPNWN